MITNELATQEELKAMEAEIRAEVDDANKRAKIDSEIAVHELTTDIYANPEYIPTIRNVLPLNELKHNRLGPAVNM